MKTILLAVLLGLGLFVLLAYAGYRLLMFLIESWD